MTPESLVRHELAGLEVSVTGASNPDLIGIEGCVRDETMKTLLVATGDGVKRVPKAGTTFRFELEKATVLVEGTRLLARPAQRSETHRGSLWQ